MLAHKLPETVRALRRQKYALDPELFLDEVLGATIYDKQKQMCRLVRDHPRVSVKGANGSGKDFTAGRLIQWWEHIHNEAITVVIGPTHRQVYDIIWRETRTAFHKSNGYIGGRMYNTARWQYDNQRYAVGFATNDEFNIDGYHSPNLLVIVTEAHNVDEAQFEAIERLDANRVLLTGNALTDSGTFRSSFYENAHLWETLTISAFDTPNVVTGQDVIPGLVTVAQVEHLKELWGEESPLYISSILAEFPDSLDDVIVKRGKVMDAMQRELEPEEGEELYLGVDVARFGADSSVIYSRKGHQCRLVWEGQGYDTQAVAGIVATKAVELGARKIVVDVVGVGAGVFDTLKVHREADYAVIAFNGGEAARRNQRYFNAVSEAWLELADAFDKDMIDIGNDQALLGELTSRKKVIQGDRRTRIEPKVDYRKRVRKSPDHADALAMLYSPYAHVGGIGGIYL